MSMIIKQLIRSLIDDFVQVIDEDYDVINNDGDVEDDASMMKSLIMSLMRMSLVIDENVIQDDVVINEDCVIGDASNYVSYDKCHGYQLHHSFIAKCFK